MGLTHDTQAQALAEIDRKIVQAQALRAAKSLAKQLILYERCEDPKAYLNLPNPTHELIRIRKKYGPRSPVPDEVKEHNLSTATLGQGDEWERLWHR